MCFSERYMDVSGMIMMIYAAAIKIIDLKDISYNSEVTCFLVGIDLNMKTR